MTRKQSLKIVLVLAIWGGQVVKASPAYEVIGIGVAGFNTVAYAINSQGQVAGTTTSPFGDTSAFTWSGGSMLDLTPLPNSFQQSGNSINASGTVAGNAAGRDGYIPVMWQSGTISQIGGLTGDARAINDAGDVAGMMLDADGNGRAFRTSNGQVENLGVLNGGQWSAAYGMNNKGDVVGYGDNAHGAMQGFALVNGTMYEVGAAGGWSSYAMAINDAGQVTGNATNGNGYAQAFVWQNGSMTTLGTLGGSASYGQGLNGNGDVVGASWMMRDELMAAFLYRNGVLLDLNQLVAPGSGWHLESAHGINDQGQIVGSGTFNGQQSAFFLNPLPQQDGLLLGPAMAVVETPEPGTAGMLVAAGLAFLTAGAWRSKRRAQK